MNKIICGDSLEVLPELPKAKMIFADPPDNLGMKYNGYADRQNSSDYVAWLAATVCDGTAYSDIFWLSYNAMWRWSLYDYLGREHNDRMSVYEKREFIWRFTFGQHNKHDCGNGYRPILRIMRPSAKLYPDAIRVPSARQTLYNDKRANPKSRVPDDVWEFSRVCGTFKERRQWHPNQHPEALIERIVKFSCKKGDLVIDMFAGTGTVNRVCKRLGVNCIGIEISKYYCEKIAEELNIPLISGAKKGGAK